MEKFETIFFSNVEGHGDSEITVSENDCLISDPQSVAEIPDTNFVSIGQTTNSIYKGLTENSTINEIIRYFKVHSSIKTINNFLTNNSTLSFKPITKESLRQIFVKLNHKKAHGHDMINAKKALKKGYSLTSYKKKDSFNKENYRPVSQLTTFSKVFLPRTNFLDLLKTGKQNWKGTNILAMSLWCLNYVSLY